MSMDQHIFSDIKEAWKHFLSFEPPGRKIKWSRVMEGSDQRDQRRYSLFKILLQAICARF